MSEKDEELSTEIRKKIRARLEPLMLGQHESTIKAFEDYCVVEIRALTEVLACDPILKIMVNVMGVLLEGEKTITPRDLHMISLEVLTDELKERIEKGKAAAVAS